MRSALKKGLSNSFLFCSLDNNLKSRMRNLKDRKTFIVSVIKMLVVSVFCRFYFCILLEYIFVIYFRKNFPVTVFILACVLE